LGIIGFIAVIAEMMMGDWGLLFVLINTNAEANIAALGYAIFSIFMTIGRLSGDFIANKFTTEEIIRTFAVIASGGIILTTLTSEVFIVFLGFAFIGIGLSVLIPIVFKIAGNIQDVETGTGIAGIGLFTSLAGISGPIIIGQIADLFTLKTAFLVIALVLGSIIILSKGLKAKKGAKVLN
jgi:fucose permease